MNSEIRYGRKRNGIKKELEAKIEDWLKSIDDLDTSILARRDVIVTGGSIASMLLGERINDFDIYFKTKETTEAVAKYYVEKFNKKHAMPNAEGVDERSCIPIVRTETIKNIKGEEEDRVVIFIKSSGVAAETDTTYQYFEMTPPERHAAEEFVDSLVKEEEEALSAGERYRPIFLSQNAITLSGKMQIVIRFFGEPDKIHDNYDFVHAMNYYDFSQRNLVLHPEALEALLSRTLIYKGSLYPIASIFRTKKFIERGWRITAGQLLKIMWQISEINLKDPATLREQLTGVDAAYMHQLVSALSDVDSDKINSAYVATLIDKIFD